MAKKKTDPFEESLKKLQAIVEKMERGDLPLEDAVESYTEGIRLAQACHQKLEEAEARVRMLMKDTEGDWKPVPFDVSPGGTGEED
ncbi:MAG: exodeoxyribonuclease VII small subunit [Syntrophobacteraceae bacterium]|jgi:exodeoxyribonuclease VII small subunit|nr:exodeoxyribonuclease VII small subunit [Syntrophobacteraceae bacterium]